MLPARKDDGLDLPGTGRDRSRKRSAMLTLARDLPETSTHDAPASDTTEISSNDIHSISWYAYIM
jgi:hypothetical protein